MKQTEHFHDTHQFTCWQQLCEGDKSAFEEIARHNYTTLYHYGTRFTQDRDLIKDCIQDLFLEIWEKRDTLIHILAIKPYLFQSLRNNLVRRIKKQAIFSDIAKNECDIMDEISPESDWIFLETAQLTNIRLQNAIDLLPKRQREALYLKYYEDLSYEEIATVMGLQRQAVANYLQYGIQKLREHWHYNAILLTLVFDFISL